jgi:HEAT repeat protein
LIENLRMATTSSQAGRLSRALRAEDPAARADVLRRVGKSSPADVTPQIVELLEDRNWEVRYEAAHALGRVLAGSALAPAALLRCIDDRNELVRIAASEAAGDIGDKRAIPRLRRRLSDRSPIVRSWAAFALGMLGGRSARGALTNASRRERSALARVGIYGALFQLGDQQSLHSLLALLRSKRYVVRNAVANTVAELTLDDESRTEVRRALRQALTTEQTIAATSSLKSALRRL